MFRLEKVASFFYFVSYQINLSFFVFRVFSYKKMFYVVKAENRHGDPCHTQFIFTQAGSVMMSKLMCSLQHEPQE